MSAEQREEEKQAFYRMVGERLRVARKILGLSEIEAAAASGVTLLTYRKYEKGGIMKSAGPLIFVPNSMCPSTGSRVTTRRDS
jgi:hypothetical protein